MPLDTLLKNLAGRDVTKNNKRIILAQNISNLL